MKTEIEISATALKMTWPKILRGLEHGMYARVVVTRRGKPVAELVPPRAPSPRLWGSLRGSIVVSPAVDLTGPSLGEPFDAGRGATDR